MTNHPHLAQALEQWRENTSGTEPERHVQVKIELSKVAAFAAGPFPARSLSTTCVAECLRQARREEVQWCRGVGVWDPVLRKDMNAEGAKTASLRWFDTDKGDAARLNYRSRLVVQEIKKVMKRSGFLSAAELLSGMPLLESVKAFFSLSLFVSHTQEEAKGKRVLAMYDISRAHFHGTPVRREKKRTLGRGEGQARTLIWIRSGIRWLAENVQVWHGGCECSWASE